MILGVLSKLTLDAINKNLGVSKVFWEKNFEVKLCDMSSVFVAALILAYKRLIEPQRYEMRNEVRFIIMMPENLK